MKKIILAVIFLLCAAPAWATFSYNSNPFGSNPAVIPSNNDFEVNIGGWGIVESALPTQDTSKGHTGTASAKYTAPTSTKVAITNTWITVTPNTVYRLSGYIWNELTTAGNARFDIDTVGSGGTPSVCGAGSTSGYGAWQYVSCTFNTNAGTTGIKIRILVDGALSGNTGSVWYDSIGIVPTVLNVPAGSAGRRVELYPTSGTPLLSVTCGDTSCDMGYTVTNVGSYFWRITDTDGSTFRDNSGWISLAPGDIYDWTDSTLAKDATWGLVSVGNETDGYAMKVQRNGADYGFFGPALGANLATGKTASASSSFSATCGQDGSACNGIDGNMGSRWLTTSAAPQWYCVDLASSQSFNRVDLVSRLGEGYGGKNMQIQTSDTSCSSGMVDVSGVGGSVTNRPQYEEDLTVFTFTSETKRYVRIYFSAVWQRPEVWEMRVYYDDASNPRWGIDQIRWRGNTLYGSRYLGPVKFTTLTTESDGSTTLSETLTAGAVTLDVDVNYKQVSPNVWRKRYTLTPSHDGYMEIRDALLRPSTQCFKVDANSNSACASANNDTKPFQATAVGTPYIFGQTADNGCNAKWSVDTAWKSKEVTGVKYQDGIVSNYVTYGKRSDSLSYFELKAGQVEVFDVAVFRSIDPTPYATHIQAATALADARDRQGFNNFDKATWATAYQLLRIPRMDTQDICMMYASQHYAAEGMYPTDMIWNVIGLDDEKVTRKVVAALQKATGFYAGGLISNTNTFDLSPPSFKNSQSGAQVLGFAVRKGYVEIAETCASAEDCVTTSERDALFNAIDATFPADGINYSGMCCDSLDPTLQTGVNLKDVYLSPAVEPFIVYRALQDAGASIDTGKMANLKAKYANQYDATDGYIHWGKYGHWIPVTDAGASGGQYYDAAGDYVAPTTVRFVVPSGHSAANITLHYRTASNYGEIVIKKNGTAVTESPLDLYAASPAFSSTLLTETVSTDDVITIEATTTKNASSTSYRFSLDKIVVGASTYEEDDSSGVFQCGSIGGDCLGGYTRGWKRWKSPGLVLIPEFISRSVYGESVLTDAQIRSHIGNMPTGNMGNGSFNDYYATEEDKCIPSGYYLAGYGACQFYQNGGSWFVFDAVPLRLSSSYMTDDPVLYKWDEKNDKFALTGTWTNETDSANYYQQYVWKSSSAGATAEFSGVHLSDAWVYMTTGAGQGTVKIYFDDGGGYDAGTTIDLSAASNPVYSQTALTYEVDYRIKIEVVSGTVRLDYIQTNTKPSYLLSERRAQDFEVTPWTKEWVHQDYYNSSYKSGTGSAVDYYGWNILYGGLSAYPKFRLMMDDLYFRRVN